MKENNCEEYVKISLNRYKELLDNNRKAKLLYEALDELRGITQEREFLLEGNIQKRIYKLYERIYKEI